MKPKGLSYDTLFDETRKANGISRLVNMKMGTSVFLMFTVLPCVWSGDWTKIRHHGISDINFVYPDLSPRFMNIESDTRRPQSAFCPADSGKIIMQCIRGFLWLDMNGFPWGYNKTHQHEQEEQSRSNMGDPLDPINYTCAEFDAYQTCLEYNHIPDECLFTPGGGAFSINVLFDVICHIEKPSINLLRSMECLQKSRVVDLIEFHLANRYDSAVLDRERQGRKNAFFTFMNSETLLNMSIVPNVVATSIAGGLVCLEERGLVQYIPEIVSRNCDNYAVRLVKRYFAEYRQTFTVVAKKIGFSDVCNNHAQVKRVPTRNLAEQGFAPDLGKLGTKEEFEQFLERWASGSALDTIFGKYLLGRIKEIPVKAMCDIHNLDLEVSTCTLATEDKEEISRFNVLYAAHSENLFSHHGPPCQRLDILRSCWNLLASICGEEYLRYFNHTFTLIIGSCGIKREMEDIPCQWQDTLYKYYIGASEGGNLWPTGYNLLRRPMELQSGTHFMGELLKSASSLFYSLKESTSEIGKRCSQTPADSIRIFFRDLNYEAFDLYKGIYLLQHVQPIHVNSLHVQSDHSSYC